jgi:ribosomal protein S18 acetylase RimI-like enzyme
MQKVRSKFRIELVKKLDMFDLINLCRSAESTMLDSYGFSIGRKRWHPPMYRELEGYFTGVTLIPERRLVIGRLEKNIVGSLQLLFPNSFNKLSGFTVSIHDLFVIDEVRHSGIASAMIDFAERYSKKEGYKLMRLSIRSDMFAAIALFEKLGYKRWGVLDKYELLGEEIKSGHFYCKEL